MKNIKIIKYEHKYAEAVAVMWQNSAKGWNGETLFTTKQAVITYEENSVHLNVWLALDGDLVVGYCNLYEYQQDRGALYIGLLNVRDDYHGKKIGKALVLKAVNRTIEMGWKRLDLYTWSGNTKAVPLYKKCGFFWEDSNYGTHLINLIPAVLNNELIKDHFKKIDWYNDSIREIEVKPDGRKENGFEYFTYSWQKNEKKLLMEYCRRGRGLRKIENNDFSITVTVDDLKLVFGNNYKIRYEIENKSEKPLQLKIKGISEKNIEFDFETEFVVKNKKILEAKFFVKPVEKEQSEFKTYPNVISEISINGKKSVFKTGIEPKFPAKIILKNINDICYNDVEMSTFLDIENCYKEKAVFSFSLPNTDDITFKKNSYKIELNAKKKKSIPVNFILKKGCVYSQNVIIKTQKNEEEFTFKRKIESIFVTYTDMFYGKTQQIHIVANGKYLLIFRYKDFINNLNFVDVSVKSGIAIRYPKLGKPFNDEFNKRLYDKVEYSTEGAISKFVVHFSSEVKKNVKFRMILKLHPNGILKRWFEFEYFGKEQMNKKLILKTNMGMSLQKTVMHYDGKLIGTKGDTMNGASKWDSTKITEPWLFSDTANATTGIIWDKETPLQFGEWEQFFEEILGMMKPEEKITTKPVTYFINTFKSYHELRKYALKRNIKKEKILESLDFEVNNGNPFINKEISVSVQEYKKINMNGKISIFSEKMKSGTNLGEFKENDDNKKLNGIISHTKPFDIDVLKMKADFDHLKFSRKKAVFQTKDEKVTYNKKDDILSVSNGIITLEASEKFAPVLFSMKYGKNEWLDSSYPKTIAKSWWKPWTGGIYSFPNDLRMITILDEKYNVNFVEKCDNFGNNWAGISIETTFEKDEKFKGLKVTQYFLLLPGTTVMFHITEIGQNTNKYLVNQGFKTANFIKADQKLQNTSFVLKSNDHPEIRVIAGHKMYNLKTKGLSIIQGKHRLEKMIIKSATETNKITMFTDTSMLSAWIPDKITCKNGKTQFLTPHFYIFSNDNLENEELVDLENIKFE